MSRSLVHEATADDTNPPSGYILKELAQKTLVSVNDCSDILDYLLKRLDKDSPDVRLKALLAIKYLCLNGRDAFRLSLQRNTDSIRACTYYKGPLDPLRGDAPYQRVREAAKDAIAAVFDNSVRATQANVAGRIRGMGNPNPSPSSASSASANSAPQERDAHPTDYSSGTYSVPKLESGAYSTGRMQGFGNPNFEQPKPSFVDRLRNSSSTPDGYREYSRPAAYNPEANTPAPATADVSKPRARGMVGGDWSNESSSLAAERNSPASFQSNPNSNSNSTFNYNYPQPSSSTNTTRPTRSSSSSGEYEGGLIDKITTATGVRPTPTKQELKEFMDKGRSLDQNIVAQLLQKKFSAPAYQTVLKSLCVVEALVQNDFAGVVEFFRNENDALIELESHANKQVSSKASQILVLIGLKEAPARAVEDVVTSTASAPQRTAAVVDLIGIDESVNNMTISSGPMPTTSAYGGHSLIDDIASTPTTAPAASQAPNWSGLTIKQSTAQPTQSPAPVGVIDPFSSLSAPGPTSNSSTVQSSSLVGQPANPLASLFSSRDPVEEMIRAKQPTATGYGQPIMQPDPFSSIGAGPGPAMPMYPPATFAQTAYPMPGVAMNMGMGMPNPMFPGVMGTYPQSSVPLRPAPMAMPEFRVQQKTDKPIRRDFVGDPLAPVPKDQNAGGFAFINQQKDAFDFVQEHLKNS